MYVHPIVILLSPFCSMMVAVISVVTVKHTVPLLFLASIVYHHTMLHSDTCLLAAHKCNYMPVV
jgi:hypothetical protein